VLYVNILPHGVTSQEIPSKFSNEFRIFFYHFYTGDAGQLSVLKSTVESNGVIDMMRDKVLYVLNIGLHYNKLSDSYRTEMTAAFQYFMSLQEKYGNNHRTVFRETSAQHFNTINGGYDGIGGYPYINSMLLHQGNTIHSTAVRMFGVETSNSLIGLKQIQENATETEFDLCRALTQEQFKSQMWRTSVALELLRSVDPNNTIKVAKFYRISAARYESHLSNLDCTHFCNNPMIWLPLWHNIHRAIIEMFDEINKPY
jgi:hypothetical protein